MTTFRFNSVRLSFLNVYFPQTYEPDETGEVLESFSRGFTRVFVENRRSIP